MRIKHLQLINFRSWEKYQLDFDDITIFIGPNGTGKTNILEATWMLADGRSWRTSKDQETIQWNKDYGRIVGEVENSDNLKLELFLSKPSTTQLGGKVVKINSVKSRIIDLFGLMPAVLFSPESVNYISGAPALRRRFLDILLSQIDRAYILALLDYFKVLRERNRLLEQINLGRGKENELDFWDERLAEDGIKILSARIKAIDFFNQHLSATYAKISGKKDQAKLVYRPTIDQDKFLEALVANHEREIRQGTTTAGPHRDDWVIYLNERDLSLFGSRGEFRSAILSLKLLELRYVEECTKKKPLLLLDDIFSELDLERRSHLAEIVLDQQTIITTTDLEHIDKKLAAKAKIIKLE